MYGLHYNFFVRHIVFVRLCVILHTHAHTNTHTHTHTHTHARARTRVFLCVRCVFEVMKLYFSFTYSIVGSWHDGLVYMAGSHYPAICRIELTAVVGGRGITDSGRLYLYLYLYVYILARTCGSVVGPSAAGCAGGGACKGQGGIDP